MPENVSHFSNAENSILIVESDAEFRLSLTRLLKRDGFEVFIAESFKQSQLYFKKRPHALVIFGLNQPSSESIRHLDQILSSRMQPSVIILSSYNRCELRKDFERFKNLNILIKPVKKEEIIKQIHKTKIPGNYNP